VTSLVFRLRRFGLNDLMRPNLRIRVSDIDRLIGGY